MVSDQLAIGKCDNFFVEACIIHNAQSWCVWGITSPVAMLTQLLPVSMLVLAWKFGVFTNC